ncbi:hypothetical protein D3C84_852380 [compost metagenome]
MCRTLPKPLLKATVLSGRSAVSNRFLAQSIRALCRNSMGVIFTSRAKTLAKWRALMLARPAMRSMLKASSRCSSTWFCTRVIGVSWGATAAISGLNCAWPPWRFMTTNNTLATSWATFLPWSSATTASARSMPAVTPPDVMRLRSWT